MTSTLSTFDVLNQQSNEIHRIDFVEGLEDKHLKFVKEKWGPKLDNCRARAILAFYALPQPQQTLRAWQNKQAMFGAPDAHWNWSYKKNSMLSSAHRIFALINDESVEALMRIDLSCNSRSQQNSLTPIVYIDYLAVAPWNRSEIQEPAQFKGFGTLLLGVAVSISFEEEMKGRCGLHSLAQSEGFYTKAGMADLGIDPMNSLRYFEFLPEAAKKFLGGLG